MQFSPPSISCKPTSSEIHFSPGLHSFIALYADQFLPDLSCIYLNLRLLYISPLLEISLGTNPFVRHRGPFTAVLDVDIIMPESSICTILLCFSLQWEDCRSSPPWQDFHMPSGNYGNSKCLRSFMKCFLPLPIRETQVPFSEVGYWTDAILIFPLNIPTCL